MSYIKEKNIELKDEKSIFIDDNVIIGKNVIIYENNRIEKNSIIGDNTILLPNNFISNSIIGKNCKINHSQIEDSQIMDSCEIGPYAHLRPNSYVCENAKIGNFVEIKNAKIGKMTKVNHLAYVGDAEIGENCNIGCGAIFVNYNGKIKQKTIVGDECFIGSNSNIIAPVVIESKSYICAGTTVTENIKTDDFVIGRVKQEIKEKRAHRYLKKIQKEK